MRVQKSQWFWLLLIILVGIGLKAIVITWSTHVPESDELAYQSMAINLISGKEILDHLGNHAMYNVGYSLFVLAPAFYFSGENILSAQILNILLNVVSIALCYLIVKEIGGGRIARLLAAGILAIYLAASVYIVYLAKENLMTPLMLGVVWCSLKFLQSPSVWVALICGLLLGLLALTGNAGLSLLAIVIFSFALAPTSLSQRIKFFLLVIASLILIASPWAIRNAQVIGAPVLNTNGGFNLYLGNNPSATGMFISIADTPLGDSWHTMRKELGEVRASQVLREEAISWIINNPFTFFQLSLKKAWYFWTPPFHQGKGEGSRAENVVRVLWGIQFVLICLAALASLTVRKLRNKKTFIIWIAILAYTAIHMLFYVIFRYREPIMPLMGIMAAIFIEHMFVRSGCKDQSQV